MYFCLFIFLACKRFLVEPYRSTPYPCHRFWEGGYWESIKREQLFPSAPGLLKDIMFFFSERKKAWSTVVIHTTFQNYLSYGNSMFFQRRQETKLLLINNNSNTKIRICRIRNPVLAWSWEEFTRIR